MKLSECQRKSAENFLKEIVCAYRTARTTTIDDNRIIRGRSRIISSVAEELFAKYIISNNNHINNILVDQEFRPNIDKKFFPDVSIIIQGKLCIAFDVKMNLGWYRGENRFKEIANKHELISSKIRGRKISYIDGIDKSNKNYIDAHQDFTYNIVVIGGFNISKNSLDKILYHTKRLHSVMLFILSDSTDLNSYDPNINFNYERMVQEEDFNNIDQLIKKFAK